MAAKENSPREWGKVEKLEIIPPYNIVCEQADVFNKNFQQGEMYCRVIRNLVDPKQNLFDVDDILAPDDELPKAEKDTLVKLYVEVPTLDNYQLQLVKVTYKVSKLYPCELVNSINKQSYQCETSSAFKEKLLEVLTSESISTRLSVLYSQVAD